MPGAPVFFPTVEEFQNPLAYIASIKKVGETAGIVKIVPPTGRRSVLAAQAARMIHYYSAAQHFLAQGCLLCLMCMCLMQTDAGWKPSFELKNDDQRFPTKRQLLHKLQEGLPFDEVLLHLFAAVCIVVNLVPFYQLGAACRVRSTHSRLTVFEPTISSSSGCKVIQKCRLHCKLCQW